MRQHVIKVATTGLQQIPAVAGLRTATVPGRATRLTTAGALTPNRPTARTGFARGYPTANQTLTITLLFYVYKGLPRLVVFCVGGVVQVMLVAFCARSQVLPEAGTAYGSSTELCALAVLTLRPFSATGWGSLARAINGSFLIAPCAGGHTYVRRLGVHLVDEPCPYGHLSFSVLLEYTFSFLDTDPSEA